MGEVSRGAGADGVEANAGTVAEMEVGVWGGRAAAVNVVGGGYTKLAKKGRMTTERMLPDFPGLEADLQRVFRLHVINRMNAAAPMLRRIPKTIQHEDSPRGIIRSAGDAEDFAYQRLQATLSN